MRKCLEDAHACKVMNILLSLRASPRDKSPVRDNRRQYRGTHSSLLASPRAEPRLLVRLREVLSLVSRLNDF